MASDKRTILIVEDDEPIRQAIAVGLERNGFEVLQAVDGEEGLKTALAEHPDLILLDLRMPKKTGQEMLDDLREDKWGADVPVIVLSNADDNLDIYLATKDGRTSYAIKSSMELDEIIKLIKFRLGKK
jgi:DNA-binding response OmpR family regulator